MPQEILRTFIAIELDEPLLIAIGRVQGKFKRQVPDGSVRWVAPNAMHLTLKFLGDTPAARVPDVTAAIRQACTGLAPFDITIEGRGCFPNCRRPRVIWVAVHDHGHSLAGLQAAVERHVSPLGWPTEERAFSPHLTLGRVGRNVRPGEEAAVGQVVEKSVVELIGTQRVAELHYIKSDLRPSGPIYTTLAVLPLMLGGQAES